VTTRYQQLSGVPDYARIHTVTRNIYPDTVLGERFLVAIESLEAAFNITRAGSIHGCILLMSEDDTWTRHALTTSFCALPAN